MPTVLPTTPQVGRVLSWPEIARFYMLIAWSRWLHHRLMAADRKIRHRETDAAGLKLLAVAREWLRCHEEIARLLGQLVPPQVAQVRAALRVPAPTKPPAVP